MSSNLIQLLISTLVPILIQEAEVLLKVSPNPQDSSWVAGLIAEMVSLISKYIPEYAMPAALEIEQLIAAEIEKVLGIKSVASPLPRD